MKRILAKIQLLQTLQRGRMCEVCGGQVGLFDVQSPTTAPFEVENLLQNMLWHNPNYKQMPRVVTIGPNLLARS